MRSLLVAVALGAPLLASAATNLLANGNFESGLSGWTVTGGGTYPPAAFVYATDKAFGETIPADNLTVGSPDIGSTTGVYFVDDVVSQSVSRTYTAPAAGNYIAGFDYYLPLNGAANPAVTTFTVTVSDADGVDLQHTGTVSTAEAGKWQHYEATFFDVPATHTVTFAFNPGGSATLAAKDVIYDRAFVIAAVPEPGTYGLMAGGLMAVGFIARRRGKRN